jgi:hypothetical protein
MAPAIGRSLKQGFQVANRSWAGMGIYAGGWVIVFAVAFLGFLLSGAPQEAFQAPAVRAPAAAAPAAVPDVAAPTDAAAVPAPADAAVDPAPPAQPTTAQQAAMAEWIGRAWPLLAVLVLVVIAASTWLYAGQIGYLAARVRGEPATVATFLSSASRAFGLLLASSLLMLVAVAGVGLVVVLIGAVLSALPSAVAGVLGAVLLVAGVAAITWVMVRAAFWFIAVVADARGPVAGLRASLAATRGKWWNTCGLLVVLFAMAISVLVVLNLLGGLGEILGGGVGTVLQVLVALAQVLLLNLYLGFVFIAASIRFYEDAKAPAANA